MNEVNKGKTRRHFSPEFKAKVALAANKGDKTANQIAIDFDIHPMLVGQWKKELLENAGQLFNVKRGTKPSADKKSVQEEHLYNKIGRLQIEIDWLKKKSGLSMGKL